MNARITMLCLDELDLFVDHLRAQSAESGRDGDPISHPQSRKRVFDVERMWRSCQEAWLRAVGEPSWERAWAAWDGSQIVGHADLRSSSLPTEQHRCVLGLGVLRSHRRRGLGLELMRTCIQWAREQPQLDWLDLGVFANNAPAIALYEKLGFQRLGAIPDRFRVDGVSITDIQMTLSIAS